MARQQAPIAAVVLGAVLALALRYGRDELHKHLTADNGVVPTLSLTPNNRWRGP